MIKAYLSLGGNTGNQLYWFEAAKKSIEDTIGEITMESSYFESEPWGFHHENHFWNQVIAVRTGFSPENLLRKTLCIENKLGRLRNSSTGYEARNIDIDILFFAEAIFETKQLSIPHKHIAGRRFILEPMAEIAPNFIHPVFLKPMDYLLQNCKDKGMVRKLPLIKVG